MTADEPEVLEIHFGHAASCSSVGSVVDLLFASSVAAGAVYAAVTAALTSGDSESTDPEAHEEQKPVAEPEHR